GFKSRRGRQDSKGLAGNLDFWSWSNLVQLGRRLYRQSSLVHDHLYQLALGFALLRAYGLHRKMKCNGKLYRSAPSWELARSNARPAFAFYAGVCHPQVW